MGKTIKQIRHFEAEDSLEIMQLVHQKKKRTKAMRQERRDRRIDNLCGELDAFVQL